MEQSPWSQADERYTLQYMLRPPSIPVLDIEQAFVVVDDGYEGDEEGPVEWQREVASARSTSYCPWMD